MYMRIYGWHAGCGVWVWDLMHWGLVRRRVCGAARRLVWASKIGKWVCGCGCGTLWETGPACLRGLVRPHACGATGLPAGFVLDRTLCLCCASTSSLKA